MTITIADGRGALWQWDTGRRVRVDDNSVKQVHYQNRCFGRSVDVDVGTDGTAIIPDELLQDWHPLTAYAYVTDDAGGYTKVQVDFAVHKRAKPADYVYTPTDQMTLQMIQRQIGDLAGLTTEAKDTLVAAINEAAASGGAGSMDLRVSGGYIQYSTDGGGTWQNLISVAELKGEKGDPGVKGDPGEKGADGTPGIYYGTTPPAGDTRPVWLDPDGDHDDGGLLPAVTGADNGKVLRVVGGAWSPVDMPSGGGIHDVSWHTWDNVIVPEGGLNAFDFTTLASGEKLSDHQVKGMFIYSPSAVSAAHTESDQTATLTVNGDYVFSLVTFARSNPGYLRLLLTVEDGRLIVRYYKRDTDDRVDFPATTVSINKEDLHSFGNLTKASTTIIGYGKTLKLFNRIESVRIESSGQVVKDVEFDVQVMY